MSYLTVLIIALMLVGLCVAFAKSVYEVTVTAGIAGTAIGGAFYAIGLAVSQGITDVFDDLARTLMLGGSTVVGLGLFTLIVGSAFAAASKRELPRRSEVHVRRQDVGYIWR